MKTSSRGIELIKKYEGCELTSYKCSAGVNTIGWGNTYYEDGSKVQIGDTITQERADELLLNLLPKYENQVKSRIRRELNQNEFDALVSFVWNCWYSETLFRYVNERNVNTVEWWKTHYIKAGGKVLNGLVKRREEEAELYIS